MRITNGFSRSVIESAQRKGISENEIRKDFKESSIAAGLCIGLGLLLAIIFGSIKQEALWLFFAGLILWAVLFVSGLVALISYRIYTLAIIFAYTGFIGGIIVISKIPSNPVVMYLLFVGTIVGLAAQFFKIQLSIIKNEINEGRVFPQVEPRKTKGKPETS